MRRAPAAQLAASIAPCSARVAGVADRDRERVGRVVGLRRAGEAEQRADHLLHLALGALRRCRRRPS